MKLMKPILTAGASVAMLCACGGGNKFSGITGKMKACGHKSVWSTNILVSGIHYQTGGSGGTAARISASIIANKDATTVSWTIPAVITNSRVIINSLSLKFVEILMLFSGSGAADMIDSKNVFTDAQKEKAVIKEDQNQYSIDFTTDTAQQGPIFEWDNNFKLTHFKQFAGGWRTDLTFTYSGIDCFVK